MMSEHGFSEPNTQPRAPRSAGLAGIAFSVLFLMFALLLGARPPAGLSEAGLVEWFEGTAKTPVTIAVLYVAPFAGIAFLWFLAVVRDRIGAREDRFLSTVFLGSGLLFVAMFGRRVRRSPASSPAIDSRAGRRSARPISSRFGRWLSIPFRVRCPRGRRVHDRDLHDRAPDGRLSAVGSASPGTSSRLLFF